MVVVPGLQRFQRADGDHQRGLFALKKAGGPDGQARGVGESEVLVEAALERRREVGVTVDEAREERLASPVVDVGVGIRPEDRVGRADRRDPVACDRERHVVLNGIDVHDGRVSEDDVLPGGRLSLDAALVRGGAQRRRRRLRRAAVDG